jgi:hypothetical protein
MEVKYISVAPRDYDGGAIKLLCVCEQKYLHPCSRKKALPMQTVKVSISPETEEREKAFKMKRNY